MRKVGERVGCILGAKDKKVKFLGYGTYIGNEVPKEAAGWMAEGLIEHDLTNPKIELDNGDIVYGCECWWGGEEHVKEMLDNYDGEIVEIKIEKVRKEYALQKDQSGDE
jgi:hypothetical protein